MQPELIKTPQKGLRLIDAIALISGSMIGSGIFITSADIARQVGSPGMLMLNWIAAGALTICAALSYGELAAAMPKAGGQYVFLKEAYNKLFGFLYGWTLFTVIQTGTIAAVGVAFAKFTGVFFPAISGDNVLFSIFSFHFSTQQCLAISIIVLLTLFNFRSIKSGAFVQNLFTFIKVAALLFMIVAGLVAGINGKGDMHHFTPFFTGSFSFDTILIFGAAMVGSAFSADAWNNVTFTAAEVRNPQRNLPIALILGTGLVISIYILVNFIYLYILPISAIAHAQNDRVGTLLMQNVFGNAGLYFMAAVIMVSTFGCLNGLILSGSRVYYAMAKDGLFFKQAGQLNKNNVPAKSLILQCIWASVLTLTGSYSNLLDYVIFAVMIFYILTITGIFILRKKKPNMERPYKVFGYPYVPILYLIIATTICISLIIKRPEYTYPGLGIVLLGIPVFYVVNRKKG